MRQILLRLHVDHDDIRVDDSDREAKRELARAGMMYPVSGFIAAQRRFVGSRRRNGNSARIFF
jgi:hypothetical protein